MKVAIPLAVMVIVLLPYIQSRLSGIKFYENIQVASIISVIVVSIVGFSFWPYFKHRFNWEFAFFHIVAICFLLSSLAVFVQTKRHTFKYRMAIIYVTLAMNNLVDEVWGNPTKLQLNEYIFLALIVTHQLHLYLIEKRKGLT